MVRVPILLGAALLSLTATSCTSGGPAATPVASPAPHGKAVAAALAAFGDCAELTRTVRAEALTQVTAYGLQQQSFGLEDRAFGTGRAAQATSATSYSSLDSAKAVTAPLPQDVSGTTNQERGVDEPDLVKTNGRLMVIASGHSSHLKVLDITGDRPVQLADLVLHLDGATLMLDGDTLVAIGEAVRDGRVVTVAEVVDLSDPAAPRAVRRFRLDGSLVDGRFVNHRILLAISSQPHLAFTRPSKKVTSAAALKANQAVIAHATVNDLLPAVSVTPGGKTFRADCAKTLHTGVASGVGRTSLVTLDPDKADPTQHVTVIGDPTTVYAGTSALYLATTPVAGRTSFRVASTDLHGFDVTDPDHLRFLGSGEVEGSLPDQYALSEHKGYLRVATTVFGNGTDNRITILKPGGGVLTKVGQVGGLGLGEQTGGVRFLGDKGYVVTFVRLSDPLYVVDLSDPTRPALRGQLELTGFSSALFELGGDQLLGLGQGSGGRGGGTQASVFDVQDPTAPALLDKEVFGGSYSAAERDHHALLWWPKTRDVVMPLNNTAAVLHIGTDGTIARTGTIASHGGQLERAVVVGDLLYSVSESGVVTTPLERLTDQTWLPFL
jgi:uncharacterized secreted protein with C-terminal beta-propeller domain